jgi:RecA/RadA recombinase
MAAKKKKVARKPKTRAAAPAPKQLSRRKQIAALMNQINRKAKKPVIRFAEDSPNKFYLRRPTGIMQLDVDLAGGFPAASIGTLSGPWGGGKTTLLYRMFAQQQRLYGDSATIAFASPESPIDFWWARKNGWIIAVPDELIEAEQEARELQGMPLLTSEEIMELKTEIGTNIRIEGDDGEDLLNHLQSFISSGLCQIVALDSLESIIPRAEAKISDYHDSPQQASKATLSTRFMQHWGAMMNSVGENMTTFMVTCQMRANRKKGEAPPHIARYLPTDAASTPNAVKHWRCIDLQVQGGEKIKRQVNNVKKQVGKMIKWETGKGRAGTHEGITGEVEFDYDGLIDTHDCILLAGMKYGTIGESNGLFTVYREAGDDPNWEKMDRDAFAQRMADFENELLVRREILAAAGFRCLYR